MHTCLIFTTSSQNVGKVNTKSIPKSMTDGHTGATLNALLSTVVMGHGVKTRVVLDKEDSLSHALILSAEPIGDHRYHTGYPETTNATKNNKRY